MPDTSPNPPHRPVRRLRPAEELLRSGERLYYDGEFLLAAREFARARRHDPTLFEAWAGEGLQPVSTGFRGGFIRRRSVAFQRHDAVAPPSSHNAFQRVCPFRLQPLPQRG